MVQGLRFCASDTGVEIQSLVGELRFHMPRGVVKNKIIKKKKPKKEKRNFSLLLAILLDDYSLSEYKMV